MDFNATVDLIIKDLNDARDIIDDLKNYKGVPLIQVELAKSKCKSAAEVIALLKNVKNEYQAIEPAPVKEEESEPVKKKTDKRIKEPAATIIAEKKEIPVEAPVNQTFSKPAESTIIADTFGLTDRVNEKMGVQRDDETMPEIMKSKILTSLPDAIGVNDRFLFIRELFSGNQEAYTQTISRLDNAVNLEDAKAIIMSYIGANKETDAIRQLLSLVKRKFPSDE